MFAGRRHGRIDDGRDSAFQDRLLGRPAILGVIEGSLDRVQLGTNVNGCAMLRTCLEPRTSAEIGQLRQGDVDLERGAVVIDPLNRRGKIRRQLARIEKPLKSYMGVGIACDNRSLKL